MNPRSLLAFLTCVVSPIAVLAARKPIAHTVGLGSVKRVPYSVAADPSGASPGETELRVRPLIIDDHVKEWTSGDIHTITDRSFAVRRALRLNDSLPGDKGEHWVWQRGPWLLVDRTSGHYVALKLPEYDPVVSQVSWYRDYAAYCGLTVSGKQLYAVVAQLGARKPVLSKKLGVRDLQVALVQEPSALPGTPTVPSSPATAACTLAVWQRDPLRVTFQPAGEASVSYDLIGLSAVLVEDGDSDEPSGDSPVKPKSGSS